MEKTMELEKKMVENGDLKVQKKKKRLGGIRTMPFILVSSFAGLPKKPSKKTLTPAKSSTPKPSGGSSAAPLALNPVSRARKTAEATEKLGQLWGSLRDQDDESLVEIDASTGQPTGDRGQKRHVEGSSTGEGKGKRPRQDEPISMVEGMPDSDSNQLLKMDTKEVALNLRKAQRLLNFYARESIKRMSAPLDTFDDLKKQLHLLKNEMITKAASHASLEAHCTKLGQELEKARDEKKALVAELERKKVQVESLKVEVKDLRVLMADLQKKIDNFPAELEAKQKTAIEGYRQSKELVEELGVLMGTAMRGGYTKAINQMKALNPDLKVEDIDKDDDFDLDAADSYDMFINEFREGTSLVEKYMTADAPTPENVDAPVETSEKVPDNPTSPDPAADA